MEMMNLTGIRSIDRSIDRSRKVIVQDVDPNSQESEPVEEILNAQKTGDIESAPTQQLFEIRGFDRSEKKPAICEFCTDLILKS